ncbi:Helix-turn-helix domain-containing protein [Saccharopolyspora antimicrobica]|uniref:AraC family transcriptional regulator n=1 Tax=Saccharopolyspora antimicrobica TaxID=455193 RepID=A0A1I4SVF2_9PSEU|nr:AraC family transcriptional regulator [Saccharopolyspora antimicrobica]SFM68385.1 Helix-turn-helix domain-containing protein [Saccharopolyspora antimicrobica]
MREPVAGALPKTCSAERGAVWLLPGEALYCGPTLRLDEHTGAASCLAIGIDEPLRVAVGGSVAHHRSVFIPPRLTCQITPTGRLACYFLEPGSPQERACLAVVRPGEGIRTGHRHERELAELAGSLSEPGGLQRWVERATGDAVVRRDERITAAVAMLSAEPDLSAARLAAAVHLSPAHFLRLFKRDTGTTLRRFRLWARMLVAAAHIADGADLTRAAAAAGFASPSHFSSVFHAMFGLAPSRLLAVPLDVHVRQREAPGEPVSGGFAR